ncbi:hypothetical protein HanPSC8_Chr03g0087401 [Helianthus annuus]|nr:hypothetical protein HanPSC8_Chr03g0087401 [Helianthus annuus]
MICIRPLHLIHEFYASLDAEAHERIKIWMRTYTHVSPCFDPLCLADRCSLYHIHTTSMYIYYTQNSITSSYTKHCEKLRKR